VFVTPTWVSGALGMARDTFLAWNALAALVSTLIATLGAYGIGSAVLGQLSARRGTISLAIAALTLTALVIAIRRRHGPPPPGGKTK
jgi:membrane protein DedA with SNARE-associated domain